MTRLAQPCAGSNGSTVTNANATSGDQWNTVTASGTGTTITYDNAQTIHGNATSTKLHFATVASTDFTSWKASIPTPAANAYVRFYIYRTADPSVAGTRICHMLTGSASPAGALQITTGGKLRIINSAGTTLATSTASLPTSAWTRVEFEVTGISGSTGTITARFYSGGNLEGATPDETITSGAGAAVGGTINEARIGCSTSITQSTAWDLWVADVAWSDTAQPGSLITNIAGPRAIINNAVAQVGTVTTTSSATIAGVIAALSMLAPAGTVAATQNPTVAGVVATATADAPAGTVTAGADINVAGVRAVIQAHVAPPGAVHIDGGAAGPAAAITVAAPAGVVGIVANITMAGPAAAISLVAPAGTVRVTTPDLIQFRRSTSDAAHVATVNPTLKYGEPVWDTWALRIGPPGDGPHNDQPYTAMHGPGTVRTVTTTQAITTTDRVVVGNGSSITVTLPTPVGIPGRRYTVKNIHSTSLTVATAASTIDGASTLSLAQWAKAEVVSDGSQWLTV